MQLSRFAVFALPALAVATAVPRDSTCSTGSTVCCNSAQSVGSLSHDTTLLLGTLGVALGGLTGLVGLDCLPITALGVGGTSCNSQALCCENNTFGGLISLGCNNINL